LPSSLTPEVAKTTGVFYEMARWFSNRPFLVMFTPPLAEPDAGTIHLRTNGEEETFRFPRNWWQGLNPFDHSLLSV
jgi:hypothetical protein